MSGNKQFQLLEDVDGTLSQSKKCKPPSEDITNWEKCIICQEESRNPANILQCPANKDSGAGYETLSKYLASFNELGRLDFNLARLDEGQGVVKTLVRRSALVHKLCKANYSKSRLSRILTSKRKLQSCLNSNGRKYIRDSGKHLNEKRDEWKCFLCEKTDTADALHEVCTFDVDARVRKCAIELEDTKLIANLSPGDLVAQEAKYHRHCLVTLYNKSRKLKSNLENTQYRMNHIIHGIALAEIIEYISQEKLKEVTPVFKLCKLSELYCNKIEYHGASQTERIHTTRLKERIMAHFPDMVAFSEGRDVLLTFRGDVGTALVKACREDRDEDGQCLVKSANILRRDMECKNSLFTGSFDEGCQISSVPPTLLSFIKMVLDGPNIVTESHLKQTALSIAQLIQFNFHIRPCRQSKNIHHNCTNETPLPMYVGLLVHSETRSRSLVDKLFELGLSVSYDRVLSVSTLLANSVCNRYIQDNVVCPLGLRKSLFTVAAVDNIDHNPSSTTAKESFHGTGISLFQYPSKDLPGIRRNITITELDDAASKKLIIPLPEFYTCVPSVMVPIKSPPIPKASGPLIPKIQLIHTSKNKDHK